MNFAFSEEQTMMADVVRELLARECGSAALRGQMSAACSFDRERWRKLLELGLAGVLVPEDAGGLGLGGADFVQIAEACGYACLPEPLVDHAGVVLPLLADSEGETARAALTQGLETGTVIALTHPQTPWIVAANAASAFVLPGPDGLRLVRSEEVRRVQQAGIDPLRQLFTVSAEPAAGALIAAPGAMAALLARAAERGAVFTAAELVGLAQACVDLAVAYAGERRQFGRPIGANQAIKHHLASAQVKIEFARPVVHAAAALVPALSEGVPQSLESRARVSHALLAAGEAATLAARTALQVHGAMGYSWEVDVHLYLKRALSLTQRWGGQEHHRQRIAERILTAPLGPDRLFPQVAEETGTTPMKRTA
ncbi:acyl-CoA dehydrogenase family protein [Stappia indica]|uniref:acyl-CoA dehydrogenase family protein n=1 Tax=Stappia indica TaxID=538381 RepID=UPI001CD447F1|nr:acyl-CoA dehydrogenase family protein [Stappia indica]MCA1299431.1 acyl-CoA/acyl-ACP dehydrogenase [Stappia indica]